VPLAPDVEGIGPRYVIRIIGLGIDEFVCTPRRNHLKRGLDQAAVRIENRDT